VEGGRASAFIARAPSAFCAHRLALPPGSGVPHSENGALSNSGLTARKRKDFSGALEWRRSRSASNVAIQRSMHDKPRIALHLRRVAAIIMNAVTDEDQR